MKNRASKTPHALHALVLDGETRAALAVTRSLGQKAVQVAVGSSHPRPLAGASRFCKNVFSSPSPTKQPTEFANWVLEIIEKNPPTMLIPCTDASLKPLLKFRDLIASKTAFPFVASKIEELVSNKDKLLQVASELRIKCPDTLLIMDLESLENQHDLLKGFSYPAVIKPRSTVSICGTEQLKLGVFYVDNFSEAAQTLRDKITLGVPLLLQQRIVGTGVGVFALCSAGKVLTTFAHRRVLEKPPSGGPSVLSESIPSSEAPVSEASRLLQHLSWEGVSMIEFKQTQSGEFYLMEINPRFWGSLQLAIDCGRDFPWLLYKMACAEGSARAEVESEISALMPYLEGRRLRWELGSLDHMIIRLKEENFRAIKDFLFGNALSIDYKWKRTAGEVLRFSDTKPFFCELLNWFLKR